MSYDRADWHYGGDFPSDLPPEAGGTHIGMFLAWAILNRLEGEVHHEDEQGKLALAAVRNRQMTGRDFLISQCDGKFWDQDLNDEGNAFALAYYVPESAPYLTDYEATLGADLPSLYHVKDTWANYDRLAPVIDGRFEAWRQTRDSGTAMPLSAEARPDLDALLNALLPFAEERVRKHGAFYPFGATFAIGGELVLKASDPGLGDHPPSQAVIDSLEQGLRQEAFAGSIRAAAICYDARVVPPGGSAKTDAIAIRAQHKSGEAIEAFVPYRRGLLRKVTFGELFASATTFSVFPPPGSAA